MIFEIISLLFRRRRRVWKMSTGAGKKQPLISRNNKVSPAASQAKSAANAKTSNNNNNTSKKSLPSKPSTKATAAAAAAAVAAAQKPPTPPPPPPAPAPSEEELRVSRAALVIQCAWRRHGARRQLRSLRADKEALDAKLRQLEQDAYLRMVHEEREREAKQRERKAREKEAKRRRDARRKRFLEAAYDGNVQELKFLVDDLERELENNNSAAAAAAAGEETMDESKKRQAVLDLYDARDMNNNSALSEAAAGGSAETCSWLLRNGAEPNSTGAFARTPLWRCVFAGHVECVQVLLANGGDPRLASSDAQRPCDVATKAPIVELLANWSIELTERMCEQMASKRRELKQQQLVGLDARRAHAQQAYERVHSEYEHARNELLKCNLELQRLHDEYLLNEAMYAPLIETKEAEKSQLYYIQLNCLNWKHL